jgi:predicted phage terminase large subunit-like protein
VALPAFWLGKDPSIQILSVSYAQELALKHSRDCREILTSPWYRDLFPGTRSTATRPSLEEFNTTQGGLRLATSVGGVLTGRGADVLIIDDPLKPQEALSDLQRNAVNEWFSNTLYSRLNCKETGTIILIMQRLHQDDLVGHVLENGEAWEVVSFPAIAEEEETFLVPGIAGVGAPTTWRRRVGDPLHAGRESLETLQRIRESMTSYDWACQYQQQPVPLGGGLIKNGWWRTYQGDPGPFVRIIQSWDTACKESELSDYSVCTTWAERRDGPEGQSGTHYFLLHVFRKRLNYPELRRAVKELSLQFSPQQILVEDQASGTQLVQDLIHDGLGKVTGVRFPGDKVMRMHSQSALIENGFVYLPKEAPWLDEYLAELGAFPRGRHDDQVDATSQALAWMTQNRSGGFEIYVVGELPEHRWEQYWASRTHPGFL